MIRFVFLSFLRPNNTKLHHQLSRAQRLKNIIHFLLHAEYILDTVMRSQVYKLHLVSHRFDKDSTSDMQFACKQRCSALGVCFSAGCDGCSYSLLQSKIKVLGLVHG